jgi:acyl transferase domain-containing protein/acyl carrier protein/NAD(P)-dependent dehydrogenase (short-subunit alcohol dehydrogenase family)
VTRPKTTPADIAIVGMGCLFPKANHLGAFWANIKHGVDAIIETPESHWCPEDYYDADPKRPDFTYGKRGGFLDPVDFNPLAYGMPPNALEATDTAQLLGMVAAEHALRDAGIGPDTEFDRDRVSVVLGVTGALELVIPLGARLGHPKWREAMADAGLDAATINDVLERMGQHYVPWQEASFPGLLGNVVAGRITKHLNLGGTNCVVDAACASSLSAVHLAALELQAGKSDLVITGGVDTFNDIFMFMCFSKTPALSPTGNAKPFDASGDGTILGEGLGMIALKRLSDAERDHDRIYSVIKGIGASSDGKGDAIYAPSAPGQVKALKRAYEQAGIDPRTIELVEAHGTGTAKGDAVEISALSTVYGSAENGPWCAIGSVKSQIGHTKAAAGSAAIIKAAMALYMKTLPPTIKVKEPLGPLQNADTPFYVNTQLRPWLPRAEHPRRAGVSALGFGGSNFHCLLEEHQATKAAPDWDGDVELLVFSGANAAAITSALDSFPVAEKWSDQRVTAKSLREAFDTTALCRLAIVVRHGETDLPKLIAQAKSTLSSKGDSATWNIPTGVYFGTGEAPGKLAFLFPGQGTQYPGMLRDLACQFPEFLEVLASANAVFDAAPGTPRLTDRIYPHPAFTPETEADHQKQLTSTVVAPSAIGAVSAGALRVVERFGIAPDAIAGHSYGEIVGLLASGKVSESDFHLLSKLRGSLMGQGEGDKGSMMAVRATEARVQEVIESSGLKVIIANKNAPEQMVLAGGTEAIAQAEAAFSKLGIQAKVLPVAAAFHSEYVSHVRDPFLEALKGMEIGAGTVPLYANTNEAPYPNDLEAVRVLIAEQLAKPVEFVKQIQRMHADGVRTFLEIGPGARMSGLVDAILGDAPHHAVAIDGSNGKRDGIVDLARALAEIATLGYPVALEQWNDGALVDPESLKPKAKMTVPICGANYVTPREKKPKAAPRPVAVAQPAHAANTNMTNTSDTLAAPARYAVPQAAAMPTAALQATEHHLIALQRMQQQTADLHRQFLEGQQAALETFRALLGQHQGLVGGQPMAAFAPIAASPAPAPVVYRTDQSDRTDRVVAPPATMAAPAAKTTHVASNTSGIEAALLATIAEKTGYPTEMLELGMSLDADLGIDSIKRVEILSGLKERLPEAPEFGPDQLGTFHTLGDIVKYIAASSTAPAHPSYPSNPAHSASLSQGMGTISNFAIEAALLATIAEKTGYPTDMLELTMSLDADLGIDSIKRVEILSGLKDRLPEAPEFGPNQLGSFHTLGDIVKYIAANSTAPAHPSYPSNPSYSPSATPTVSTATIEAALLATIAEKTGYPTDMLELGMSLDADLGIDSIKRVEILSGLKDRLPEAPEFGPDQLGTFHTLGDIVNYIAASSAPQGIPSNPASNASPSAPAASTSAIEAALLATIAEKTGYPTDMLELTMSLDADLGIDSIKRVEILSGLKDRLPDAPEFGPDQLSTFHTLGDIVNYIAASSAPQGNPSYTSNPSYNVSAAPAPEPAIGDPLSIRAVTAVTTVLDANATLALPAEGALVVVSTGNPLGGAIAALLKDRGLDVKTSFWNDAPTTLPDALAGLILVAPEGPSPHDLIENAFTWIQQAGARMKGNRAGLLASITQLDGTFGTTFIKGDALAGGLAGLVKTAAHEWPAIACKAIDVAPDAPSPVNQVIDVLLQKSTTEIGITAEGLITLGLAPLEYAGSITSPLAPGDVVVVTGGARGVTAHVALAMAKAWKPTLVLLGRSAPPTAEAAWLAPLATEAEIRQALLARASGALKPKELREALDTVLRNREGLRNIEAMVAAGAQVEYHGTDIRDAQAVAALFDEIRAARGPIRGIVHGAGVLADRLIEDKTLEQFNQVYGTKVDGLNALLAGVGDDDLKFIALFSSSTGRFGRKGQIDYAASNEILNKIAQRESNARPNCRVVSVNWGPWAGGMVNADLAKLFKSEGVGLIGLRDGAEFLVKELSQPGPRAVELVVMGGEIPPFNVAPAPAAMGTKAASTALRTALEIDLSVDAFPFLKSHVLAGKAVLPVAMISEWFAHTALHTHPGLRFHGFDDLRVFKGVTLDADEVQTLQLCAGEVQQSRGGAAIPVELRSHLAGGKEVLHAAALVHLTETLPSGESRIKARDLQAKAYNNGGLYEGGHLFHGPAFQGLSSVDGAGNDLIAALVGKAPAPKEWILAPMRNTWLADPLILDSSFQMMILWSFRQYGVGSLPSFLKEYRQFASRFPSDGARIVIQVTEHNKRKASADIEFVDPKSGALIARISGYECTLGSFLNKAFQNNTLEMGTTAGTDADPR